MLSSAWARLTRSVSVAGGGPNSVCANELRVLAAPLRDGRDDRRRGSASGPRPRRGSIRCSVAVRNASAARSRGAPRPVEPAAALDGLRCAHHDRQAARRPADRAVGPSTAQAAATTRHNCRTIHLTWSGMRSEIARRAPMIRPRCAAGRTRSPAAASGEVHRERGVALLQQAGVGHEVGGADDRHGAAVVACSGPARRRSSASPARRLLPRRCRSHRIAPRPARVASRRSQSGSEPPKLPSAARRISRRQRLPGPRHRLHEQPVAGKRRQPAQHVVVDEVERLHRRRSGCRAVPRVRPRRCRRPRRRRRRARAAA